MLSPKANFYVKPIFRTYRPFYIYGFVIGLDHKAHNPLKLVQNVGSQSPLRVFSAFLNMKTMLFFKKHNKLNYVV